MCMAIPMQVLRMEGAFAVCTDRNGGEARIDALLTGPLTPGQWVLTFLGAARELVDAAEAKRIGDAVAALETLLAGGAVDLDACFADLVDREPKLPPHLQRFSNGTNNE
jgi:hydrogenase expression/formation protein HypC